MIDLDVSREERVLLACARAVRGRVALDELATLVRQGVDWDRLVESATRHRMLLVLNDRLSEVCPEEVPSAIKDKLQQLYVRNTAKSVRRLSETQRVVGRLREASIPAVPFKGPVLAWITYGKVGLRASADVDLLLARKDLDRAIELLTGLGYVSELTPKDQAQRRAYLRHANEWGLARATPFERLELHWEIVGRAVGCGLDVGAMVDRARPVEILGFELPSLDTKDLLLMLCVHGAKHEWDNLELLCSLAGAVEDCAESEWAAALQTASESGCRRRCLLGGLLAAELLGAPVPSPILKMARADAGVNGLATQTIGRLFSPPVWTESLAPRMGWQVQSLDGLYSKARYLFLRVAGPTPEDWAAVRLPRVLYPLYYLIRPPRLVAKHLLHL